IIGRYSLWWHNTPPYNDHRVGVIGHYAVSDGSAARQVLQHACEELAANGCTLAVGPMDGNTWRRYRLVSEFGSEPTFFLEPNNPEDWPGHFVENGFEPLAEYFSALDTDLSYEDPRMNSVADRMTAAGILIRSLDPQHFEDDLRCIYAVAKVGFRNHILYSEIAEAEFISEYQVFQHFVRHDLVLIAERHTEPVGFIFAVPDLLQAKRGDTIDTLIVKTLGVLPGRDYAGLGHLLLERVGSTAFQLGYTRLIHALVRDVGHLRKMSRESARPIRRYTLFAKELRS
ncbi:MAG: N-acetyltransferase, partial [Planctomycetes bacterium]|nr:N-acetyltransferase [Planctomycetota bacterium]